MQGYYHTVLSRFYQSSENFILDNVARMRDFCNEVTYRQLGKKPLTITANAIMVQRRANNIQYMKFANTLASKRIFCTDSTSSSLVFLSVSA